MLLALALWIRVLANPLANLIQKKLSQSGFSSERINLHTYGLLTMAGISLVGLSGLPAFNYQLLYYALLTGLFGAFGNLLLLKALEKGELSVLGPINSYKSIVALVIGIFILGEIPDWHKLPGVLLIIAGSYFVIDRKEENFSWKLLGRPDIKYRIWAMILTAIEALFLKKLIHLSDVTTAFAIWAAFGFLFVSVHYLFGKKHEKRAADSSYAYRLVAIAACIAGMQFATIYIFEKMNVGYALAIFQLSTLVSVLLGFWYFGEKDLFKKLLGSVIMIVGTLIILLL